MISPSSAPTSGGVEGGGAADTARDRVGAEVSALNSEQRSKGMTKVEKKEKTVRPRLLSRMDWMAGEGKVGLTRERALVADWLVC